MKALITGSHGFIGSHLTTWLKDRKYEVIPFDRIGMAWKDVKKLKPDYIFHLGAYGNHSKQQDSEEMFDANVYQTWLMLEHIKDLPIKRLFYFGSSSQYGIRFKSMHEMDGLQPETLYAATKTAAEYLIHGYSKTYGIPSYCLRLFSVYGPGEASFRFIPTVITSLVNQTPFSLQPEAVHDWIYILDVMDALEKLLENTRFFDVVNIGTGKSATNESIVTMLEDISGSTAMWNEVKIRDHDSMVWRADTMHAWTNYRILPKTSLYEGLKKTYESLT